MEGNCLSTCSQCFCYHFSYRTSPPGPAADSLAAFLVLSPPLLVVSISTSFCRQKTSDCLQASECFSGSIHLCITPHPRWGLNWSGHLGWIHGWRIIWPLSSIHRTWLLLTPQSQQCSWVREVFFSSPPDPPATNSWPLYKRSPHFKSSTSVFLSI